MPVDTPSEKYKYMLPIWTKARVATKGQHAVKLARTDYLPCSAGYEEAWYEGTWQRAYWYGATGATVESYQGAIFRKNPVLTPELKDTSEDQQELLQSVDNNDNDLVTFSTNVTNDMLQTSYGGILVDHDNTDGKILTQEQVKAINKRARIIYYPAESIINATKDQIRLSEVYNESTDEFTEEIKYQIKVLDVQKYQNQGRELKRYRQRIFRKKDDSDDEFEQFGNDFFPELTPGVFFEEIPFQFIGAKNNDLNPDSPILEGLVNANFQHYGLYSDMREALHWIRPFIYQTGYQKPPDGEQSVQVINPNVMLTAGPDSNYGILEFRGSGLQWDYKTLELLESQMSSMGADALKGQKRSAESADKARIDKSSEASVLATLANNISSAITISLNIMMKWNGEDTDFVFQLNTDYDATSFDAQLLTALNKSNESGNMSQRTVIWNQKKGELLPDGVSVDDEINQIDAEASGLGNQEQLTELITNIIESMKDEGGEENMTS